MKFVISRTSDMFTYPNPKPCDEAIEETFTYKDKYGKLHKHERYVIQIDSLDELLKFKEKYKSELIITDTRYDDLYEIEIYDDYRE